MRRSVTALQIFYKSAKPAAVTQYDNDVPGAMADETSQRQ